MHTTMDNTLKKRDEAQPKPKGSNSSIPVPTYMPPSLLPIAEENSGSEAGSGSQDSSSSSSSEDTRDVTPPPQRVTNSPWGHRSEPGSSANPPQRQILTGPPPPRFQPQFGSQQKQREFLNVSTTSGSDSLEQLVDNVANLKNQANKFLDLSTTGKLSPLLPEEYGIELSPLERLADNVAKLNHETMQDLYDKANSLYFALIAMSQVSEEDDSDQDISRLSVDSYADIANRILEAHPASSKYAELIEDFNKAAQSANGSPSRGWQIVGALMMAVGAALVVTGALALAGTGGLAAPIAGAMIGGGVFAMASGFTLFSVNRQRGLSNTMVEFAKSADNFSVEEEELSDDSFSY